MYGVDGGGTRASGPTCTRRAFQVRPHSTAASKQLYFFLVLYTYIHSIHIYIATLFLSCLVYIYIFPIFSLSSLYLLCLERNLKLVFVWEYTKTGKSILRPVFNQSNCKKAGPALILIESHLINNQEY